MACIMHASWSMCALYILQVFAWTQTRLNLTAWLGIGPGLSELLGDPKEAQMLRDMHNKWPWFHALVDVVDMVMAKVRLPSLAPAFS